jgi:HEAT repeat protein
MFKVGIAIVAVVAVLAVVGAVWWGIVRNGKRMGFLDYVKNPTAWKAEEESFEEYFAVIEEESKKPAEELVAGLIVDADQSGMPARAISKAGPRTVPALLAAAADPRFRGGNQKSALDTPVEPLQGVLHCLCEFDPPEAVPVVAPLVTDDNYWVRAEVARLLGSIGNDEAAPYVVRLLGDEEDFVRRRAVSGIKSAAKEGRVSERFESEIFEIVARVALADGDRAPACLLDLDRERAAHILMAPETLTADQPHLHHILKALREAQVEVDEDFLLALLSTLERRPIKRKTERSIEQILFLLATRGSERSLATIEQYVDHPSQRIREGLAEARLLAQGLDDPLGPVREKLESTGWGGLSGPQRHVVAVRRLIDEVRNGGFLQYFFNNSGDHWRDAAAGLEAIGATGDRQLFDEVLGFFKDRAPSENRDARHAEIAAIAKQKDRPLEKVEKEFYKYSDSREVLLNEFILEHADDFGTNVR